MKRRLAVSVVTAAVLAVALAAGSARAGTDTSTLTVTAEVVGTCVIDPATLSFVNYDSAADLDAQGTITVRCTSGSAFWIGLDGGNNGDRTMEGGASELLSYELYRDAAGGTIWDDTPVATTLASTVGPGLGEDTATVYGRIPANQVVSTGTYTDSVTMTVNF
jgi:spore coat protein U-like protein